MAEGFDWTRFRTKACDCNREAVHLPCAACRALNPFFRLSSCTLSLDDVKSFKRSLESIDPGHSPLKPLPSPSTSPSNAPLQPASKRKRALEDDDLDCTSSKKQLQLPSLTPPPLTLLVHQWLSQLPPIRTTRPTLQSIEIANVSTVEPLGPPKSVSVISSTKSLRPSTSDPLYRSLIHQNNVTLDPIGRAIEPEIRELLDTHILKKRDTIRLTEAEVCDVVDMAGDLQSDGEGMVSELIGTKAFPTKRHGIKEGRNIRWTIDALPFIPQYPHRLSAPKPDRHYGYPLGHMSDWTDGEKDVVEHLMVQAYSQPTRENLFPFLMFEIKSEATGGTLYVAENQAVGSGVHSVGSLRWLLKQAYPSEVPTATDAVAFTAAVSSRMAMFFIVWYSEKKKRYVMSQFWTICFLNCPGRSDIQQCRDVIENVLDYGLNIRQPIIKKALAKLHPIPGHWKMSRSASTIIQPSPIPSPATETSPTKKQKRS